MREELAHEVLPPIIYKTAKVTSLLCRRFNIHFIVFQSILLLVKAAKQVHHQ